MANQKDAIIKMTLSEKHAYVDLGGGDMLCIGSKEEADAASVEKLVEMVAHALAIAYYNTITTTGRRVVH